MTETSKATLPAERVSKEHRDAQLAVQKEQAQGMWSGKLTQKEQSALIVIQELYGLDPLLKEIVVLGGNLYVTKSGLNRVAHRDAKPPVSIQMVPITAEERKALGLTHNEPKEIQSYQHAFKCLLWKKDTPEERPYIEFGIASWGDVGLHEKTKSHKTLSDMARTRAFNRTIRIAYEIGLPSLEETDIIPEQVVNVPPGEPDHITDKQRQRLFALCNEVGIEVDKLRSFLKQMYNIKSTKEIRPYQYDMICAWIMEWQGVPKEEKKDGAAKDTSESQQEIPTHA